MLLSQNKRWWCRDWTSRSKILEEQGDTSESWQLDCLLDDTNHIELLMTSQAIEMSQGRNPISWGCKMTYFWTPSPLKMAIWASKKWISRVGVVCAASIETYVAARHGSPESCVASSVQRMKHTDSIRKTKFSNKLTSSTQYVRR